jgi:hypothetical protein
VRRAARRLTPVQESDTLSFNGNVLDQQEAIARVGQGGDEVEVCIGVVGTLILGADREGSDPWRPAALRMDGACAVMLGSGAAPGGAGAFWYNRG